MTLNQASQDYHAHGYDRAARHGEGTKSYWMEASPMVGDVSPPPSTGGIAVIGSGLTGASAAYWLLENGFDDITILDFEPGKAATYRNCGHILYGTVESMHALHALHGAEAARSIWQFSIDICHEVRETVARLGLECEYKQSGYLVIAIDEPEDKEVRHSVALLNEMGFASEYVKGEKLRQLGFSNVVGARFEPGSAEAHPVKFRNGLVREVLRRGGRYHSGVQVIEVEETGDKVSLRLQDGRELLYDACVIATSAYSPLVSRFFREKRLVEPFRGQIITSRPLKHKFAVTHPHSFDHGYEYALVTGDNRLMIGGWRNHTPGGEVGTYDIQPNPLVEDGLKDFVRRHYAFANQDAASIEWEYSWAGIMDASKSGFPYIGPTSSPRIFTSAGYTGHGFSWAHGSAKLLADIMAGHSVPAVAKYFNPKA